MHDAPTVDGWQVSDAEYGDFRFDSPDRKATIVCKRVETHAGSVFNCRLFESENPHGFGNPKTSAIAEGMGDIERTVNELERERSG